MHVFALWLALCASLCSALRYDPAHVGYNLNENETAIEPRHYNGIRSNHSFHPSPSNWRFPFYALTLDRFVDGDPTNNEANGTVFEHDWMSNQFRFGGDAAGVLDNLDYLQDMGIKAIYFTGSMMINMPWSPDGYGPLDFTLLDRHHGNIEEWRALIDEIHSRGMYVVFDNTMATMGDLMAYGGPYTNASVEFAFDEYDFIWKDPERRYHDFEPSNDWDPKCQTPRFWEQNGYPETQDVMNNFTGCRDSEFDMYGDIKGTGAYPSFINQVSRFASVQDRLREWRPDVLEKINVMSCMQIQMLDIDGFRQDKGVQTTLDAMADFSTYQRECARRVGKDNFLMVGEVVADPKLAATYFGRGKQPDQALNEPSLAVFSSNETDDSEFIRPWGRTALDGAAFHYDIYGSMTRFLGLDGPWGSLGVDWVGLWNTMLKTHDMVNANTGLFDPRHIFGTTNQDVFRWPALANGTQRQLLGLFVTTLELPGAPMLLYGEEQEFYVLENQAPDYVFGRTPMASQQAWQLHGCYNLGEELYVDMPFNQSSTGCHDDSVSRDHRDFSHPMRNIMRRFFELREEYPVLNDGFNLTTLSTRIHDIFLRGSQGMPSPHGLWSVYRGRSTAVQDFTGIRHGNVPVWQVFHNQNRSVTYDFDCGSGNSTSADGALLSAFPQGTTVKNLFYPYDTYELETSLFQLELENDTKPNGCLSQITMRPWEFKAFVPIDQWSSPKPVITRVLPGHDTRILSSVDYTQTETIPIEIHFSERMDCDSVRDSITIQSTTELEEVANLDNSSVLCKDINPELPPLVAQVPTTWSFSANIVNVAHGVHTYTVRNATTVNGTRTNSRDKFMFRVGVAHNPMVFPSTANYTAGLLHKDDSSGDLYATPQAAGADLVRYSTNWGSSYSRWQPYRGGSIKIEKQAWSGTKKQEWDGEHIIMNFWSKATGSSDHYQHSDLDRDDQPPRRWPHAFIEGLFNQWGYDEGIENRMEQDKDGNWTFDLFTEWPTNISVNVWGMNPDGYPDKSAAYGDLDRDGVLDWVWPNSLANNFINISQAPSYDSIGFRLVVNDGNYSYFLRPHGSRAIQAVVLILLCLVPILSAAFGVRAFTQSFYKVKLNKVGSQAKVKSGRWSHLSCMLLPFSNGINCRTEGQRDSAASQTDENPSNDSQTSVSGPALAAAAGSPNRRTVLIATMEYEIEDYGVKIKIGGLGVMANLMGKNLTHQNLVWVVPCVGGIVYPFEEGSQTTSIAVSILGEVHLITAYEHIVDNITYLLLDAPVFRARTKTEPYPPRMDDLDSGIYYSTWNQCIAEAYRRYEPDLYHINDYHGACAPLYLLPEVIPCCLSLHNAEFQGMWPLRTADQMQETASIFNLSPEVIKRYVQFGEVFNLLHAGASYLRIHQQGFGAVGVSKKYGKRSLARYPIFWGLNKIGSLPNPDPSDTAPWDKNATIQTAHVDPVQEAARAALREKAQQWAGLIVDANAELFIFVGRWSMQKGIDLIADVFPSVLAKHPKTQLICVGPVIDLYGKFAALKLDRLMARYPGRVYSKPEFTTLPPFLFSGAEFALMPSRDEPFGLVAVEFGRKGAICIGARVGGFGNMPGFYFTVESMTSKHLTSQFRKAISAALELDTESRASMRAHALIQRFPVAQWVEDLEILQSRSISKCEQSLARPEGLQKLRTMMSNPSLISLATTRTAVEPNGVPWSSHGTPVNQSRNITPTVSQIDLRTLSSAHGHGLISPANELASVPPQQSWSPRYQRHNYTQSGQDTTPGTPGNWDVQTPGPSRPVSPFDPAALHMGLSRVNDGDRRKTAMSTYGGSTPLFNDSRGTYFDSFSKKLDVPDARSADSSLTIEEYIINSEKDWFGKYHLASLKNSQEMSSKASLLHGLRSNKQSRAASPVTQDRTVVREVKAEPDSEYQELFGEDYVPPTGIRRLMQRKLGSSWYLYCVLLAVGQILSANSYQITLLTGEVGAPAVKLYVLCTIYIIASITWWTMYRTAPAIYSLSLPFAFFGLSFLVLGMSKSVSTPASRGWMFNVAAGLYIAGSAAGSLFFSLNFGTEGGTPSQTWAFRACVIAGSQQLLVAFLWYWGSYLTHTGVVDSYIPSSSALTAVTIPLAILMWAIGVALFFGLPDYYRQKPGFVSSFYRAIIRRGIVVWFWVMVILQNYWLSAPYNRNWLFLWSSQNAPRWAVALLVILFFVFIWAGMLFTLGHASKQHSWIIPIFAIALGAPRWCQMLWSLSGIGFHIPWAGLAGGALISRAVWLWLGVLDALQGVGFGMILLMTLTRFHITFTLIAAQSIGALFTILARMTAPNKIGAGTVFINLASDSLASIWFWIALICQLIICVGYFKFFRKAQLMKP